jgi:ribose transport system permease protein
MLLVFEKKAAGPLSRPRFGHGGAARELVLLALILLIVVGMSIASSHFLSMANARAMAAGLVPTGILVVGMTYLLVSGGFDLSVGSVLALTSTICAYLLTLGVSIPLAVLGTLCIGALVGSLNGIMVTASASTR